MHPARTRRSTVHQSEHGLLFVPRRGCGTAPDRGLDQSRSVERRAFGDMDTDCGKNGQRPPADRRRQHVGSRTHGRSDDNGRPGRTIHKNHTGNRPHPAVDLQYDRRIHHGGGHLPQCPVCGRIYLHIRHRSRQLGQSGRHHRYSERQEIHARPVPGHSLPPL